MRNFFVILVSGFLLTSCEENKVSTLSGKIENAGNAFLLISDDPNYIPDTIAIKKGEFIRSLELSDPTFKYLTFGKTRKEIFLAPGYALTLSLNSPNELFFKTGGKGAAENNALDSISKISAQLNFERIYAPDTKAAITYIDSSFNIFQHYLDQLSSTMSLDPAFTEAESSALLYTAAAFKMQIGMHKKIKDPAYYTFLKNIDLENDRQMGIPEYRDLLRACLNVRANDTLREATDSTEPSNEEYLDAFLSAAEKIKNKKIREFFIFDKISLFTERDMLKDVNHYQRYFIAHNTDPAYTKKMNNSYSRYEQSYLLLPGKLAPEFTLPDASNKELSLSGLKGKYVYIDFWATWCRPCIKEFPAYSRLQTDYKNKDIVFLSISFDYDKSKWLNFLKENQPTGLNLFAEKGMDSDIAKAYRINAIPAFVLINKEGKIITSHAPIPTSQETRKTLDNLLSAPPI